MNKRTYILVFLLLLAGFTSELSAQKKPKKAKQEISVVSGQVGFLSPERWLRLWRAPISPVRTPTAHSA